MTVKEGLFAWVPWCLALVLLGPPGLGRADAAGGVLTLRQALDIALSQNPSLENAQLEVSKASESVKVTRTRELPSLKLEFVGSHNLTPQTYRFNAGVFGTVPTQNVDVPVKGDYSSAVSLSLSQPLSELYRIGLSLDQKNVTTKIVEQQLRANRQEIARRVKQAYYTLLRTRNLLRASEESVAFYAELERVVKQNYRQKTALEYQLLEVQSHLARSQHEALKNRRRMQNEEEKLNYLLGRNLGDRFSVTQTALTRQPAPTVDQAEATAVAQRPEINEAKLKLQHAQFGYRIERSKYLPDIGLRLRYTRLYNTELIPDRESAVELTARWNFFDWGRKSHDLNEKNYAIGQALNQVREARSRVLADVDSSIRKLSDARDLVKVTKLAVAAAKEKARVLMNQYRQKTALLDDVLKAQSEWVDAVTEHANAQLGVWTAQAELTRAMGEE